MDEVFSNEFREIVAYSREIAIDMGYDYISTIHFFLADCEKKLPGSIFKFAFENENQYLQFKEHYRLDKENLLHFSNESLPLTMEAETTIRLSIDEKTFYKQTEVFACHFFIAALKNTKSHLFACFKHNENVAKNITDYYDELGCFEKSRMSVNEISKLNHNSSKSNIKSLFVSLKEIFQNKNSL